jgi:hypothetical protein
MWQLCTHFSCVYSKHVFLVHISNNIVACDLGSLPQNIHLSLYYSLGLQRARTENPSHAITLVRVTCDTLYYNCILTKYSIQSLITYALVDFIIVAVIGQVPVAAR